MTGERLFGWRHAFDHPVTVWISAGAGGLIVLAVLLIGILSAAGVVKPPLRRELWKRTVSWSILVPLIVGPVLLGAAWHFAAVTLLALMCFREYSRATGLFREPLVCATVVGSILAVMFTAVDHWYRLFVALFPIGASLIAAVSIAPDRPQGYIQRVGLGVLGFLFFGVALGHLAYLGNDANYRPMVLMLVLSVQLNDVFAFVVGKTLGRRKLVPNTSPNKTIAGALGALVLTTGLAAVVGHFVYLGTELDCAPLLVLLGLVLGLSGQFGDLVLSSIKRDIGIKDMGALIPGHGGILDRFNSLLLAAPAYFHFVGYVIGVGLDQPARILTGP